MSNIYPEWWNKSITIFNRYDDPVTNVVKWFSHHIDGCFWNYTHDKVLVGETVLETFSIICRIPKQENFLYRKDWVALPNDQMPEYFTLGANDIIVLGTVDDEIDEYTPKKRSNDLIAKYKDQQGCLSIDTFSIDVDGGRCCEHYHVRGM